MLTKKMAIQITAEPALFLFIIALDLQVTTHSALWYRKTCENLYKDEWICDNINKNETLKDEEIHVQQVRGLCQ